MEKNTLKTIGDGMFFFFFGLMISPLNLWMWEGYEDSSYTLLVPLILLPAIAYLFYFRSFYFRNLSKDLATLIPLFVLEILHVVAKGKTHNDPALDAIMRGDESASIMLLGLLVCILAAAIRRYKVALLYLGLTVGIFITRCMIGTFFDENNIIE